MPPAAQAGSAKPAKGKLPVHAAMGNDDIPGYAEGSNWIQAAVPASHKGLLHKKLGVKQGDKIPAGKLASASHSDNPKLRHEAQFAENMKHLAYGDQNIQPTPQDFAMGTEEVFPMGGPSNTVLDKKAMKTLPQGTTKEAKAEVAGAAKGMPARKPKK